MDEIDDVSQATATVAIDVDKQTTSVHYTRLFNLGNYENEKIGITVQVLEGQAVQDVIAAAELEVGKQHQEHQEHQGIQEKIAEAREKLWRLERKTSEMERSIKDLEQQRADLETAVKELAEANPQAVEKLATTAFKVGDWVTFRKWGRGKVTMVDARDKEAMYFVEFESGQTEWFPALLKPTEPPAETETSEVAASIEPDEGDDDDDREEEEYEDDPDF
jgi:hypothetical protein